MPNIKKRTTAHASGPELDGPKTQIINGVTLTQAPTYMVVETDFRMDLSLYERDVLRLLQSACAIWGGTWSGSIDDLLSALRDISTRKNSVKFS